MDEVIKYILPKITTKKVIFTIFTLIIIIVVLFPYIDTNFFYSKRIQNRIEALEKISNIDATKIDNNPQLKKEYENILNEIEKSNDKYATTLWNESSNTNKTEKLISGGLLFWIIAPFVLFSKSNQEKKKFVRIIYNLLAVILVAAFGFLAGFVFSLIPTIINPWINYIGAPVVLLTLIGLLVYKVDKKE